MYVFALIFFLLNPAHASPHILNFDEAAKVREVIAEYLFENGSYENLSEKFSVDSRSYQTGVWILGILEPRLYSEVSSVKSRNIIALKLALQLLKDLSLSPSQAEALAERLNPVLERYSSNGSMHDLLIKTYNHYDLWSLREFWYLLQRSGDNSNILKNYDALLKVGPFLSENQKEQIAARMGRISSYTLETLMLMHELHILRPNRYAQLLHLMYREFMPFEASPNEYAWQARRPQFAQTSRRAIAVLESLQELYNSSDANFVKILKTVRSKASTPQEVLFLDMFASNQFRAEDGGVKNRFPLLGQERPQDPLRINTDIEATKAIEAATTSKYEPIITAREGQVIYVEFGTPNACKNLFSL